MDLVTLVQTSATTCRASSTSATITGSVILLAIVAGLVTLGIATSRARTRLAAANTELAYLRPENARLQEWVAHLTGSPSPSGHSSPYPTAGPQAADWHADPSERHELRFWDGTSWTDHVSDHGVTGTDPVG